VIPNEVLDFELMRPAGMNWSWTELQATPIYVRRFCWDLLNIRREAEREAELEASRKKKRGDAHGH
jgi:hypothetical protein